MKPKSTLIDLAMEIGAIADTCLEDHFTEHGKSIDFEAMLEHSPIVFYVSALKEDGTDDLLDHLVNLATPCKEWAVQSGQSTNMTELEQVQEIIREKIYRTCHRGKFIISSISFFLSSSLFIISLNFSLSILIYVYAYV